MISFCVGYCVYAFVCVCSLLLIGCVTLNVNMFMRMGVFVCFYLCVLVWVWLYVCMHVFLCTCICLGVFMCVHTYVWVFRCEMGMFVWVSVSVYNFLLLHMIVFVLYLCKFQLFCVCFCEIMCKLYFYVFCLCNCFFVSFLDVCI